MTTGYVSVYSTYMYSIEELVKTEKRLFHISDLAVIWRIINRKTLQMRLYRYLENEQLYHIQRGLYSLVPLEKLDPIEVGVALNHGYCYLTTETILERYGVINQRVTHITFVGEKSKRLEWRDNRYMFRKLKIEYLMRNPGVSDENGVLTASLERAVADILYFNSKFHFDSPNLINWNKVKEIQKEVGYHQ